MSNHATTPWRERFLSKILIPDDPDACWLWQAGTFSTGYGCFWIPPGRSRHASRVMWIVAFDADPGDQFVLHNCPAGDNPLCVNPFHLWLGTTQDNTADMVTKGRQAIGPQVGGARLTEVQVDEIRTRFVSYDAAHGGRALAREYGVSFSTISAIITRRIWGHR